MATLLVTAVDVPKCGWCLCQLLIEFCTIYGRDLQLTRNPQLKTGAAVLKQANGMIYERLLGHATIFARTCSR